MRTLDTSPIVEADGTPTNEFRELINELLRYIPIVGEGSPEGVVDALMYSLYIDSVTGQEYRKLQPEIGGDRSKGWA